MKIMNYLNKRVALASAAILLTAGLASVTDAYTRGQIADAWVAADSSTKEMNWYFKPNDKNEPPADTPEAKVLRQYGGNNLGNTEEKEIYLTFDMGFEGGQTEQILDTLKKHDVPAAFFVVQHYIESEPEITKRIVSEGHLVCNHSSNHKNMAQITDFAAYQKEMNGVADAYQALIGEPMPKFHRPPEGTFSELSLKYAQDMGYTTVMWSFAYKDWEVDNQPSREYALGKIYPRTHNGEIALLHATSQTNADILDEVLTEWKEQGYTFKSLNELPKQTTEE